MIRNVWPVALFAMCVYSLEAANPVNENAANHPVSQAVTSLPGPSVAAVSGSTPSTPPVMNVLTVIGENALGVPCLDCLLGILIPSLGLPTPLGKAYRGQTYQVDSFLIDNSYTGACTFNFALSDSHNNVIASTTRTLNEVAGTQILLTTQLTIPRTTVVGLGSISNTATCGSTMTQSSSPVFLACVNNPPFCVE